MGAPSLPVLYMYTKYKVPGTITSCAGTHVSLVPGTSLRSSVGCCSTMNTTIFLFYMGGVLGACPTVQTASIASQKAFPQAPGNRTHWRHVPPSGTPVLVSAMIHDTSVLRHLASFGGRVYSHT